jgi:hypothetical protein
VGEKRAKQQIEEAKASNDAGLLMQVMRHHPRKRQVNEDAIMGLLEISKQGDTIIPYLIQAEMLPLIHLTMKRFHQSASVQTKCLALIASTAKNSTACSLWGKQGVIRNAIETYNKFENNFAVQQQVIWACNELAKNATNVERLERDGLKMLLRSLSKEDTKRKNARCVCSFCYYHTVNG